jgi:hypothetical protein
MPRTSIQVVEFGRRSDLFESSGAVQALDLNLADGIHSLHLQAMEVSAFFMTVTGIERFLGRAVTDKDTGRTDRRIRPVRTD